MAIICRNYNLLYLQVPGTGCSVVGRVLTTMMGGEELGRKHCDLSELLRLQLIEESKIENLLVVANIRNPFDRLVTYYQRIKGGWSTENYLEVKKRHVQRLKDSNGASRDEIYALEVSIENIAKDANRRKRIVRFIPFNIWLPVTLLRWKIAEVYESKDTGRISLINNLFPMLDHVDVVLKQETLQDSMNALFAALGTDNQINLERRNSTPGKKNYLNYYNFLNKWLVRQAAGPLLQKYQYEFCGGSHKNDYLVLSPKGKKIIAHAKGVSHRPSSD